MVLKVDVKKVSLAKFRREAKLWYPSQSKKLFKNGKVIAKYSAKTKRVKIL